MPFSFGQIEEWTVSAILLSIAGFLLFVSFLIRKKQFYFRLTVCDILLFLYLIYILFRLDDYLTVPDYLLTFFTLNLLYIFVRLLNINQLRFVVPLLAIFLVFQVIYFFYRKGFSWDAITDIDGIYNNTGIWGGFTGIASVGIYGLLLFSRQYKFILSILFLFSFCLLICSLSRAAWTGAFGGYVFVSFYFLWKKYGSKILLPTVAIILFSVPVFYYTGKILYRLKPVSADGRFYIWKISSRMLSEHPLVGIGVDKFKSGYMYYQASYFAENPESPFEKIADNISVPFSEPLKIAIEQGIIGFVFFLSIIFTALIPVMKKKPVDSQKERKKHDNKIAYCRYAAILITLLLFSCFSYPFLFIQFNVLFITCLAVLSRFQSGFRFSFNHNFQFFSFITFLFIASYFLYGGMRYSLYMKKLHHHIVRYEINNPENRTMFFESLESVLYSNPVFLGSYSNMLSFNKSYGKAIEKLKQSLSCRASYSTCLELGRNYEQSGETVLAMEYWELASRMIPSRFEPLYLQIRNCHFNEQYRKADSLTVLFLKKERKVETVRIDVMTRDVRRWEKERGESGIEN